MGVVHRCKGNDFGETDCFKQGITKLVSMHKVLHKSETINTFSKMLATAKMVDGETSCSFFAMDFNRFSAVSFRPSLTSQNLSVFAVHKTIT